jgi:hypothetical protein
MRMQCWDMPRAGVQEATRLWSLRRGLTNRDRSRCYLASLFALAWWPWAFFASAIVLAAVAAIAGIVLPDCPKGKDTYLVQGVKNSLHHYIVQLDLLGSVTGVLGLVLFNFA